MIAQTFTRMATLAFLALPQGLAADPLPTPTGEVLLTVSGSITNTNDGDATLFDRAMLEALDPVTFTTTTIWTEGPQEFTGVSLKTLMETVGAEAASLSATAVNDYAVKIPDSDWVDGGPIVAFLQNGASMSLREKGPLWVVYPFDDNAKYQNEVTYSRAIWQLDRIEVAD
ncbi:oxidoreductase [Pseudooceanicola nanhaiensis]|uniref:oxidoreductase n=1 Tax=Pseudooceanicola nanhaiensis TaxID=375761 RepID=UPI001CD2AF0E|nr:oxidoreductase [Pseudooceanicola nanhaiensis]MCA0919815.1 oxidoreductase [Pseudooceanicola nanhaiensis]